MDGRAFLKCMKDSGLLHKSMTTTDCDLIFASVKPNGGAKRIDFTAFLRALQFVAAKRNMDLVQVAEKVCLTSKPSYSSNSAGGTSCSSANCSVDPFSFPSTGATPTSCEQVGAGRSTSSRSSSVVREPEARAADLSSLIFREEAVRLDEWDPVVTSHVRPRPTTPSRHRMPLSSGSSSSSEPIVAAICMAQTPLRSIPVSAPPGVNVQQAVPNLAAVASWRLLHDVRTAAGNQRTGTPSRARACAASPTERSSTPGRTGTPSRARVAAASPTEQSSIAARSEHLVHSTPRRSIPVSSPPSGAAVAPAQLQGPERFFYDRSTYTGVHTRGGPQASGSGVGADGYADLSTLTRREHVQDDALQRRLRERSGSRSRCAAEQELRERAATPTRDRRDLERSAAQTPTRDRARTPPRDRARTPTRSGETR
eukprot:gnl/TRDRNA2_/TRDRNA2_136875_c0_seq3.p1 gnl/TRDRNA2_/TRDRNA2_136875_c0~~gnl/TRDRNA2_/TRDRNA2_136875_c0_seq3.p1  ORF type:complete len:475 (+),score=55.98 gnl/TRDRNA2_/TRDRNA2_136875_c0_seq3:150-1427(+)